MRPPRGIPRASLVVTQKGRHHTWPAHARDLSEGEGEGEGEGESEGEGKNERLY